VQRRDRGTVEPKSTASPESVPQTIMVVQHRFKELKQRVPTK